MDCIEHGWWEAERAASSAAKAGVPITITSAPAGPQPFIDYWCGHPGFPLGGNMEAHPEIISGWFAGLNDSLKTQCFSLEEENFSSWAADTNNPKRSETWEPIGKYLFAPLSWCV